MPVRSVSAFGDVHMDIILATLNAKYPHCAFGLRHLLANLGELQPRAGILEFDINQRSLDIAEQILRQEPQIVGLGIYVWNTTQSTQLVSDLKRLRPELIVVLGGPEVSHETDQQPICRQADFVITGEADLEFASLCRQLLNGQHPPTRIIAASPPDLAKLALPYHLYAECDIAHRVIYVEASRGCPFECDFCLSALPVPVRAFPLDSFLAAMQSLLDRGCRHFKFVDRTFNLNIKTSTAILEFFLARNRPDLFLHFEMIPDHLPAALRQLIRRFPPGMLQFEVGIQTFNEAVATRIQRRQDNVVAEENLRWLRAETGVHIHADLIVGLPGEDVESFAAGFNRLVATQPQEIQVGMLKRLRGAPIARHDADWGMVYSANPPYDILKTKLIDFSTMQRLRRFARYWDLVANSGNFPEAMPALANFQEFLKFSDWLYAQTRQTHAIARARLAELLTRYFRDELGRALTLAPARGAASRQALHRT